MPSEEFLRSIIEGDLELIRADAIDKPEYGDHASEPGIMADFTEYSPFHRGHRHCMMEAKRLRPGALFVAIIPGPLERSGRGVPYIMTRQARAEIAIRAGADIVVEGPPMGVMGSGQYSLCLARMFRALDADWIPRGYRPVDGFDEVLERIRRGHRVVPRPYRIVDLDTSETVLEGKLEEDNYVIASLAGALGKIGFNFRNRFIFIKRLEGVSGTRIRDAVSRGEIGEVAHMLPAETVEVLEGEISEGRAPLHDLRLSTEILTAANSLEIGELKDLNLFDEVTASAIVRKRPYSSLADVEAAIPPSFSRHHRQRIISVLEAKVHKGLVHKYIENYPSVIRILAFKDKEILEEFKDRIPHRRLEIWQ
ncbi:nucleotidyltransferase family protein [Methanothermobacter sp. KEPCO 2]|uniref:nucleotidyltransferase family protein n=1 Tax=Methanothermobacter sp. KEPCO 2 TaxID=3240977 RepID=UPI003518A2D9